MIIRPMLHQEEEKKSPSSLAVFVIIMNCVTPTFDRVTIAHGKVHPLTEFFDSEKSQ